MSFHRVFISWLTILEDLRRDTNLLPRFLKALTSRKYSIPKFSPPIQSYISTSASSNPKLILGTMCSSKSHQRIHTKEGNSKWQHSGTFDCTHIQTFYIYWCFSCCLSPSLYLTLNNLLIKLSFAVTRSY